MKEVLQAQGHTKITNRVTRITMSKKRDPMGPKKGSYRANKLKNWIFCKSPILRFRGFWHDRTERKHILRRDRPRVSNFLSHRRVEPLKFMNFDILGKSLHHQMILGPPDGSLDSFLNTRGLWLNGLRRKSILENDLPPTNIFWEAGKPAKINIVC